MSNNTLNYEQQKGGRLIGEGTYGCVFRPNIPCSEGKFSEESDNFISKIVDDNHIDSEFHIISKWKLSKIDPEQKYIIYPIENCEISEDFDNKDIYDCDILTETVEDFDVDDTEQKNEMKKNMHELFHNVIQKYGGKSLTDFRTTSTNYIKKYQCKDYVLLYLSLLKGLLLLYVNKLSHRDIKYPNLIVYEKDGVHLGKYIDLGLMAKFVEGIDEENNNWSNWSGTDYAYWPVALDAYCSIEDGLYTKIQSALDKSSDLNEKIAFIFNKADEICHKFVRAKWYTTKKHIELMYKSYVRFLLDLFIHKKYDKNNIIDKEIQHKWDIFMLGALFSEEIKHQIIDEDDDGEFDDFNEDFADLVAKMTSLHPIERITVSDCVNTFMKIIKKHKVPLDISQEVIDDNQDEIDIILSKGHL